MRFPMETIKNLRQQRLEKAAQYSTRPNVAVSLSLLVSDEMKPRQLAYLLAIQMNDVRETKPFRTTVTVPRTLLFPTRRILF